MQCFSFIQVTTLLLWLFFASSASGWAQHAPFPPPPDPTQGIEQPIEPDSQHKLLILRQKKRFEDMQRDSAKLLELATELKHYVDKSGESILSIEVLRKTEEIDKLARQIKINMRGD